MELHKAVIPFPAFDKGLSPTLWLKTEPQHDPWFLPHPTHSRTNTESSEICFGQLYRPTSGPRNCCTHSLAKYIQNAFRLLGSVDSVLKKISQLLCPHKVDILAGEINKQISQ